MSEEGNVDKMEGKDEVEIVEEVVNETKNNVSDGGKISETPSNGLSESIEITEGVEVSFKDYEVNIKKGDKEVSRNVHPYIEVNIDGRKIILSTERDRKIERKLFGTAKAHIRNMIKGVDEGFTYKLKVANVHFPMNVSYDKENNEIIVKNFLGEKIDRKIKLVNGVEVSVKGEDIEVSCSDIEKAGNAAAQIEKGTRVRNKDRRIYQDGIFITEKPGRVFE